jgi:hypothetical protein
MTTPFAPVLAAVSKTSIEPLFGNQWLALLAILAGVAVFMVAVAAVGRWLASTHPDEPAKPVAPVVEIAKSDEPSVEIFAAIAAAIAVTLGNKARIASINPVAEPVTESSRLQWSMEGRRQIYSSHKVR